MFCYCVSLKFESSLSPTTKHNTSKNRQQAGRQAGRQDRQTDNSQYRVQTNRQTEINIPNSNIDQTCLIAV